MKVTLRDVARLAGVSTVTVSNVINNRPNVSDLTRMQVKAAIDKLGYRANIAARGLAGGRTHTLGLLLSDLSTQYIGEIVRGASEEIRRAGFELLISTAADDNELGRFELLLHLTDGIILILPHSEDEKFEIVKQDVPIVVVDHRGSEVKLPAVDIDNYSGGRAAVEYLLRLNHRRIGFVTGRFQASEERLRGYKEALLNGSIAFDSSLVVEGDFTQPSGFAATSKLLALAEPPSAIFAANDLSAFGVIEAIKERGLRIPDDVSVVGFDDIPMASQVFPPLTTIRQPLVQMGIAAAQMLIARLHGVELPSKRMTLATNLVERASTRAWCNHSGSKEEVVNKTYLDKEQRAKDILPG